MLTPRLQKVYCTNVIETLPGDGINERSEQFARTQPMISPTFAKINADQFAFFVPSWQLHEHFDDFITGGEKGDYQDKMPYVTVAQLYTLVEKFLSADGDMTTYLTDGDISISQYNTILESCQCIIEHCDLLRAVPFVLPDFILIPSNADVSVKVSVASGNLTAFQNLNSRLSTSALRVNLLPFAAYLKVWCEYFRDENLCENLYESVWENLGFNSAVGAIILTSYIAFPDWTDVDDILDKLSMFVALFGVQKRAWKKDYFTAALPFTQKGPEVLLPLSGVFPVDFTGGGSLPGAGGQAMSVDVDSQGVASLRGGSPVMGTVKGNVTLDASGLGATIQDVRRAFRLEEFYEADGRGGNRYPENTLMQWGVRTPDSRLPRAQFLGSNMSPIQISEVVQTSSTTGQPTPQGTLAGKGVSYGNNRLCRYYFTMHGFLINLYSVRVHALYEQGVHPMFSRFDRTEYAWPRFAHLGEQPVYTKELFVDSTVSENEVFGYEPRYSEYKSEKSSIHGLLKGSLNYWTMSRRFANKPVLNEEFIYNPPRLDNFAVVNPLSSPLVVEIDYRVRANRKLPFFANTESPHMAAYFQSFSYPIPADLLCPSSTLCHSRICELPHNLLFHPYCHGK